MGPPSATPVSRNFLSDPTRFGSRCRASSSSLMLFASSPGVGEYATESRSRIRVAAVARHHLQLRAAEVGLGVAAAARDDFLDVQLAEDENADRDARDLLVDAVDVRLRLGRAVHAEPRLRAVVAARAALGRSGQACAGDDGIQQREAPGAGQRLDACRAAPASARRSSACRRSAPRPSR